MGILTKNIPKAEQDLSNIPEGLQVRQKNAIAAGYSFDFDNKEKNYISYNKLRTERSDQEIIQVAKIYRLKNRDNDKEFLVWYQTSKTYDYENNLIKCPQVEKIGIENAPQTSIHKNSQNQITDIELIETQNDFYVPFTQKKVKEIFNKSRNSQNIVCYIGYCKLIQEVGTDYMTDKKMINNQNSFIEDDFDNLIQIDPKNNIKTTYSKIKIKKQSDKTEQELEEEDNLETNYNGLISEAEYKQQQEEELEEEKGKNVKKTNKEKNKTLKEVQKEKEQSEEKEKNNNKNEYGQVENESEEDQEITEAKNTAFKIGSLD